ETIVGKTSFLRMDCRNHAMSNTCLIEKMSVTFSESSDNVV
ncbi:10314_t:CDS:1, partial [Gigaspora rosea]